MLRIYNTQTRQKEEFIPKQEGKVSMYVCGVTPYNYCHLGHARAYITFDIVKKYLRFKGYDVFHVQNFTDVDDKLIKQAKEEGSTLNEIADKYIAAYYADMDALGIDRADIYPRVTEHIQEIIEVIEGLIEKGFAYQVEGDVYFDIGKFPNYGKLSGRNLEEMMAGARVQVDERKNHPMDFALWKGAKAGEPAWESPWGPGRPGWHIECSALSLKYLGNGFDIHGGGADLVFPHHENEVAQSEAYTGQAPFARYWIHNGFVTINEEKMSKSLGNFFTIRDILEIFPAKALRFLLLSTHYRSPIDFSDEKLKEAQKGLERLVEAKKRVEDVLELKEPNEGNGSSPSEEARELSRKAKVFREKFIEAMDDDFNTALAIGELFEFVREVNKMTNRCMHAAINSFDKEILRDIKVLLEEIDNVLGILTEEEKSTAGLADELIEFLLQLRQEVRKEKNWALADRIRDGLKEMGIIVEDTPQGPKWKMETGSGK
jgi:cysteinyl-tRNA synthetase